MGNLKLALFLAYKSVLKGSRWTLTLVILVMSLSFANLILTPSIMNGVADSINQEQINTLFGNIIIDPPNNQLYLNNISQIENKVAQTLGVAALAPHLNSSAAFEYEWQQAGALQEKGHRGNWNMIGIDPDKESQVTTIHESIIAGNYLSPGDTNQILLGVEIAGGSEANNKDFLTLGGVKVGERVRLTFPNNVQREYEVKGIFKARGEGANNLAYITNQEMAAVFNPLVTTENANQILVRTDQNVNENQLISQLKGLGLVGQVRSWEDYGGGIGSIIASFGIVASLIGGIGLLVAGVVMFIVIYINVANRKRQIGILRAIGINRKVVLVSYLTQALLYAATGIIFGGLIFGYIIKPFFDSHPIDLPIGLVSLAIDVSTVRNAVVGLLAAAVLAGIIPVLNITRHSIINAIWGN